MLGAEHAATQRLVRAYHAHVHAGRQRLRYRGDYAMWDRWFAIYAITVGAAAGSGIAPIGDSTCGLTRGGTAVGRNE